MRPGECCGDHLLQLRRIARGRLDPRRAAPTSSRLDGRSPCTAPRSSTLCPAERCIRRDICAARYSPPGLSGSSAASARAGWRCLAHRPIFGRSAIHTPGRNRRPSSTTPVDAAMYRALTVDWHWKPSLTLMPHSRLMIDPKVYEPSASVLPPKRRVSRRVSASYRRSSTSPLADLSSPDQTKAARTR